VVGMVRRRQIARDLRREFRAGLNARLVAADFLESFQTTD
jgi:hypothetical protein